MMEPESPTEATMLANSSTLRFPLRHKSVHADFMTRLFLLIGLGIGLFFLAVWLLDEFDWFLLVFIFVFPAVGIWGWRRASIGEVEISEIGLRVRSRANTQTYPWEDIISIKSDVADQVSSGDNRAVYRALGVGLTNRVVLIELNRSVRHHFLFNRLGTRTRGIPFGTKIIIEPEDTNGFVEAANRFLGVSRSATDRGQSRLP